MKIIKKKITSFFHRPILLLLALLERPNMRKIWNNKIHWNNGTRPARSSNLKRWPKKQQGPSAINNRDALFPGAAVHKREYSLHRRETTTGEAFHITRGADSNMKSLRQHDFFRLHKAATERMPDNLLLCFGVCAAPAEQTHPTETFPGAGTAEEQQHSIEAPSLRASLQSNLGMLRSLFEV